MRGTSRLRGRDALHAVTLEADQHPVVNHCPRDRCDRVLAFTKDTGIKVTYRQGGDTEQGNQLIAEGGVRPTGPAP